MRPGKIELPAVLLFFLAVASGGPAFALFGGGDGNAEKKHSFSTGSPVKPPDFNPSGITGSFSTKWESLGPGGGGTIMFPSFCPSDPNTIMVNCDMAGVYLTTNGGASWIMFDNLGRSNWMAFHPRDPKTILVGSNRAPMKTTDGGVTFIPEPKLVTLHSPDCAADVVIFDPDFPDLAWCSTGQWQQRHGNGGIEFSTNGGSNFNPAGGACEGNFVWSMAVDPATPKSARRVLAGSQKGVLVSNDAGKTWKKLGSWKYGECFAVAVLCPTSRKRATWFASTKSGFYRSDDRGGSWIKLDIKPGTATPEIACSPYDDKYVYASHSKGIYVSSDGGNTFKMTGQRLSKLGWIASHPEYAKWANHAGTHGAHIGGLTVYQWDAKTALCSGGSTLVITHDAGENWEQIYTTSLDSGKTWAGYGLEVTTAYGVVFNPANPNIILALYTDMGMFRSENYGQSWCRSMDGAFRDRGNGANYWNTVYHARFDPKKPSTVWMSQTAKHDLPYKWQGRSDQSNHGCFARSTNGAHNFTSITNGIPDATTAGFVFNPDSPVGKRQLFLCIMGEGVYRSDDDGMSWEKKSKGLPSSALAWYIDIGPVEKRGKKKFRAIYVTVCRENGAGLYRSEDYAENWERVGNFDMPYDVRVDPNDPNRLYVTNEGNRPGQGFCMSTDRGKTWKCTQKASRARGITVDPYENNTVFFCAGMVWVSENQGETFREINDLPKSNCTRVTVDPVDPNAIWVATFGTGYFRGPWKEGVGVEKIMTRSPGSRAVAYKKNTAARGGGGELTLNFPKLPSFPKPDPQKVESLVPQLKSWIIEAAADGFDTPFKYELFENRISEVTISAAEEDFVEFELDGDLVEQDWDEIGPGRMKSLVMAVLSKPSPEQAKAVAEYLVYSGMKEDYQQFLADMERFSEEHGKAVKSVISPVAEKKEGDVKGEEKSGEAGTE